MSVEKDPCNILKESVRDPEGGYIHKCGQFVIGKIVRLTVVGTGPRNSGSGEVVTIDQPCCPPCGIEPLAYGTINYADTSASKENAVLERLSDSE